MLGAIISYQRLSTATGLTNHHLLFMLGNENHITKVIHGVYEWYPYIYFADKTLFTGDFVAKLKILPLSS